MDVAYLLDDAVHNMGIFAYGGLGKKIGNGCINRVPNGKLENVSTMMASRKRVCKNSRLLENTDI